MTGTRRNSEIPTTGEVEVSPWESILTEVRRSGYRTQWVDARVETEAERLREIEADEPEPEDVDKHHRLRLKQSAEVRAWLDQSRLERAHGAQVARAAVSAGLSERYIASVQAEAKMIAQTLSRALEAANLTPEQTQAAHAELRVALAEVGRSLKDRHAAAGGIPVRPELEG